MRQTNLFIVAIPLLSLAVISAQATEPFDSSWESLDKYECPEWFRDAKLGIFVCWNLHSVMGIDGWYARNMYIEGHETYNHHLKTYGHPSNFGFKDFIPMWKGEKFDADDLVRRFKDAGAKYIVPIATTTTTSTAGIPSTTSGTRSTWARRRTSSVCGTRRRSSMACGLA